MSYSSSPPPSSLSKNKYEYVSINSLRPGASINFYGRVVAFKPPTATRGTDFLMSMTLVDDSLDTNFASLSSSGNGIIGLSVNIFKPDLSLFPAIRAEDDVVQCRHMRIQTFQGSLQAISTNWSAFTVFSRNEHGQWIARPEKEIESSEREVLNRISAKTGHIAALVRASPQKPNSSRKQITVDSIQPEVYFDLVAQVIKILPMKHTNMITLLLSDYTANLSIAAKPSDFDMSPDLEHRILVTTFWDNFVEKASSLREGQIVRFLNLHPRMFTDSDTGNSSLIAVLHGDRSSTEKIIPLGLVNNKGDPKIHEILNRKQELLGEEEGEPKRVSTAQQFHRSLSPTRTATLVSKNLFDTQQELPTVVNVRTPVKTRPLSMESSNSPSKRQHFSLTTTSNIDIPITLLRKILTVDECPAKFVVKGRVKQMYPREAIDVCRKFCKTCKRSIVRSRISCPTCNVTLTDWIFMFALEITDGIDKLTMIVTEQDAVRFFNGLLPTNLSSDTVSLDYVSNCLNQLLNSPIPSTFCIKSYRMDNERRYRLFDTILTI